MSNTNDSSEINNDVENGLNSESVILRTPHGVSGRKNSVGNITKDSFDDEKEKEDVDGAYLFTISIWNNIR
jgi:hypothetical protein